MWWSVKPLSQDWVGALPTTGTVKEAQLTVMFKHCLELRRPDKTYVYELKMVKAGCFNPNVVADHQIAGLQQAKKGLWHKLADMSAINGFGARKPFDTVWIVAEEAYVVPCFYKPRKYKIAVLIPIDEFLKIKASGKSILMSDCLRLFDNFKL